jgi:hypothetical protein
MMKAVIPAKLLLHNTHCVIATWRSWNYQVPPWLGSYFVATDPYGHWLVVEAGQTHQPVQDVSSPESPSVILPSPTQQVDPHVVQQCDTVPTPIIKAHVQQ